MTTEDPLDAAAGCVHATLTMLALIAVVIVVTLIVLG